MDPPATAVPFLDFATALLLGAIVGIEREKSLGARRGIGGIRTFILFAELGAVAGWLAVRMEAPGILVATLLAVAAAIVAGYVAHTRTDPESQGLTTEIAAIVVCILGAAATTGHRDVAVALGIVTSAVLAFRGAIHGTVAKIGEDDLYAGLKLLLASFVVLPLLPDRTIDPWDSVNPYRTWWLVILISSLSLLGYAAVRLLGAARGLALTGLFGGLVSSTAVTLTFARQSRDEGGAVLVRPLASGVLLAWSIMFARVLVTVALVHPPLLAPLWPPFAAMCAVALVPAVVHARGARSDGSATAVPAMPVANPFSLTAATKFGLLFAAVLLVVALVREYLPPQGLYAVAALAGTTDVDAITLSMADHAQREADAGGLATAAAAIVIAAVANTVVKASMVAALAAPALRRPVLVTTAAMLAAGAIVLVAV